VTLVDRLYFWSKLRGGHGWAFWAGPILDFLRGERTGILEFFRCAQAWYLQRVQFPPQQGLATHWESSLGLAEVTKLAKRRQSDDWAVTQVKRLSLVISWTRGRQGRKPGRLQ